MRNGTVHFRNFASDPPVDVYLRDVDASRANLTNSDDLAEDTVARATSRATPMNAGRVEMRASIDPYADLPTFDLDG